MATKSIQSTAGQLNVAQVANRVEPKILLGSSTMSASRVIVQLEQVTNTCFVAMPFHALYEVEYKSVIKPAVEDAGLTCVRGDEIYTRQAIVQDIWNSIRQARLVMAELSGRNPNVMYEIGLAHAIGKPIVFLTRNEEDIPFDLRALRCIYYDQNDPFWGTNLRSDLTRLIRATLYTPPLAAHLDGILVKNKLPKAPAQPLPRSQAESPDYDLSGTWNTSWLSRTDTEHQATLVIPIEHSNDFTASMVVMFNRLSGEQMIVQETLTGSVRDSALSLIGVNYTYVQQGSSSSSYSLDSFDLRLSDDRKSLVGKVRLKHEVREVTFIKQPSPKLSRARSN